MLFVLISAIYFIGMLFFIICTTIAIFNKLKKNKKNFGSTLLKLHRQINLLLFAQVICCK